MPRPAKPPDLSDVDITELMILAVLERHGMGPEWRRCMRGAQIGDMLDLCAALGRCSPSRSRPSSAPTAAQAACGAQHLARLVFIVTLQLDDQLHRQVPQVCLRAHFRNFLVHGPILLWPSFPRVEQGQPSQLHDGSRPRNLVAVLTPPPFIDRLQEVRVTAELYLLAWPRRPWAPRFSGFFGHRPPPRLVRPKYHKFPVSPTAIDHVNNMWYLKPTLDNEHSPTPRDRNRRLKWSTR